MTEKNRNMWKWAWSKNFFIFLILLIPIGYISVLLFLVSLIFYAASIITILDNAAMSMYRYFKDKMANSGFLGKIMYFPFFILALLFCGIVIVVSLGSAAGGGSSEA